MFSCRGYDPLDRILLGHDKALLHPMTTALQLLLIDRYIYIDINVYIYFVYDTHNE